MNCPSCGAPMRLESPARESLTCDYCGSLVFPEKNDDGVRVLGAPTEEMCPVCGIGLVDAAFMGARIRYCTRCRGMLIDMEVFRGPGADAALWAGGWRGAEGAGPERAGSAAELPALPSGDGDAFLRGTRQRDSVGLRALLAGLARSRQVDADRACSRCAAGRSRGVTPARSGSGILQLARFASQRLASKRPVSSREESSRVL